MAQFQSISRHCQSGQALSEYGLAIGLIALVALAGLTNLGSNLKVSLEKMLPQAPPPVAAVAPPASSPAAGSGNAGTPGALPAAASAGGPAAFSGVSVIQPADFTTRMTGTVATLGANGTTFELSNQLKSMAGKMLDAGEISEVEANKLHALANQGYRLAALEKLVEDASKSHSSPGEFLASSIQFDGKTYKMPEVGGLIGFGTPTELRQDIVANSNYMLETKDASPETLAFLNLYHDAISSPNLQNSPAKGVVSQLSSEISYLSDGISNMIYGAYDPNITLENLNQNTVSAATVYDSTSICYIGSGIRNQGGSCH